MSIQPQIPQPRSSQTSIESHQQPDEKKEPNHSQSTA